MNWDWPSKFLRDLGGFKGVFDGPCPRAAFENEIRQDFHLIFSFPIPGS